MESSLSTSNVLSVTSLAVLSELPTILNTDDYDKNTRSITE